MLYQHTDTDTHRAVSFQRALKRHGKPNLQRLLTGSVKMISRLVDYIVDLHPVVINQSIPRVSSPRRTRKTDDAERTDASEHTLAGSTHPFELLTTSRSYSSSCEPTKKKRRSKRSRRRPKSLEPLSHLPEAEANAEIRIVPRTPADLAREQSSFVAQWTPQSAEKNNKSGLAQVVTCVYLLPLLLDSNTLRELFWRRGIRVLEAWKPVGKQSGMIQTTITDQNKVLQGMNKKLMSWGILEAKPAGLATVTIELSRSEQFSFARISGQISNRPVQRSNNVPKKSSPSRPFLLSPSSPISFLPTSSVFFKKGSDARTTEQPTVSNQYNILGRTEEVSPKAEAKSLKVQASQQTKNVSRHDTLPKARTSTGAGDVSKQIKGDGLPSPKAQRIPSEIAAKVAVASTTGDASSQWGSRSTGSNRNRSKDKKSKHINKAMPAAVTKQPKLSITDAVPGVKASVDDKTNKPTRTEEMTKADQSKKRQKASLLPLSAEEQKKLKNFSIKRSKAVQELLTSVYKADNIAENSNRTGALAA